MLTAVLWRECLNLRRLFNHHTEIFRLQLSYMNIGNTSFMLLLYVYVASKNLEPFQMVNVCL